MEERLQIKQIRKKINSTGWTMLIYYAIMTEFVTLAMMVDMVIYGVGQVLSGAVSDPMEIFYMMMDRMQATMFSNGWGYILAIVVGAAILLLWKKPRFYKEMFVKEKKMTFPDFIQLLCVFISAQMVLQLVAYGLEWVLNLVGLSAMQALEMASFTSTGVSMFLYASFIGPVAEELLFRGLVVRTLRPYGKQLAILVSALLFGLFHGNIIQSPFAFAVGLVLAYVTVEYSIVWAIVLHVINNFVLADLPSRFAPLLPEGVMDLIMNVIMGAFTIAAIVLLIVRRREVKAFFAENRISKPERKALASSPSFWIFAGLMSVSALLTVTRLQ